ncbi:MAG: pyrimidine 5'-nucleotidase [Anaerolineales bacterium]|nr:pyrimidine 5'-nucleotidase [Anaerolineales bacterium]
MLRFGLFDLDDTLYAAQSGLWTAIGDRIDRYLVEKVGLPADGVREQRRAWFEEYGTTLNGLRAERHVDSADYLAFVHDLPLDDYLQPNPALDAMLARLPVEKVIFTNADAPHALRVLDRLGVGRHFQAVFDIQALAFVNKPEPRAYQFVLDHLGAAGPECFFVDDAPRNLQPARMLGMHTILISPAPVSARLARVDAVIDNILGLEAVVTQSGKLTPAVLPPAAGLS